MEKEIALIEVTYRFRMPEKNDSINLPLQLAKITDKAVRLVEDIEYVLLCNRTRSVFTTEYAFDQDDLAEKVAIALVDGNTTYYYDVTSQTLLLEKKEAGEILLITSDRVLSWQITDTTAEINGIHCRYATGKIETPGFSEQHVTAWFTDEYPLPFGPCDLLGLPGLIVEGQIGKMTYTASAIKYIPNQQKHISFPTKGKTLLSSEYYDQIKKLTPPPPPKSNNK